HVKGNALATVRDSSASGNGGAGFWAETAPAELNVDGSVAANNQTGIRATDSALVRLTAVTVSGNSADGLLAETSCQILPLRGNPTGPSHLDALLGDVGEVAAEEPVAGTVGGDGAVPRAADGVFGNPGARREAPQVDGARRIVRCAAEDGDARRLFFGRHRRDEAEVGAERPHGRKPVERHDDPRDARRHHVHRQSREGARRAAEHAGAALAVDRGRTPDG